jgi:N utilization substance protein A
MRGQRVKNIVRELGGEKIDIVRWSVNMGEFISASLSPAEISGVKTSEAERRAEVIVADDQLSLAIGKKGQNVRLAAKLTGWNIDIRSKSEIEEVKEIPIIGIDGIGPKTEKELKKAGYDTVGKIMKLDLKELTAVKGVGKKTAEKILKSAKELMEQKVHEVRDKKNKENREAKAEKERELVAEEDKKVKDKEQKKDEE